MCVRERDRLFDNLFFEMTSFFTPLVSERAYLMLRILSITSHSPDGENISRVDGLILWMVILVPTDRNSISSG